MQSFDRLTLDNLTIAFPSDWEDKSHGDTTYFESPDGTKGFYVALWHMEEEEQRSPSQLVEVFLAAELRSYVDGSDDREVVSTHVEQAADSVICTWDTLSRDNGYRVAGKIQARGRYVLRGTFHDYNCAEFDRSCEFFAPIIGSFELLEA